MSGMKTALGIEITQDHINMVLLKKQDDKFKLIKVAAGPVPEGTIEDGNVKNSVSLVKAIKKIKNKNGMHASRVAISLIANPVLSQILELQNEVNGNIREHINNVVKHYAVLPIKKTSLDFCKISNSSQDSRRVLIVATNGQKISSIIKEFYKNGINIDAIEPGWMAYARACLDKNVSEKSITNQLFVKINKNSLSLSMFKNQKLDFVRIQPIESIRPDSNDFIDWLTEQINAVIKFYEYSISKRNDKWQVNLFYPEDIGLNDENDNKLKSIFSDKAAFTILNSENAFIDNVIECENVKTKPSIVAIGLAMKLLAFNNSDLNINLVPSEAIQAKSREKKTLVLANIAAALITIMILSVHYFNMEIASVKASSIENSSEISSEDTKRMLLEQRDLDNEIEQISKKHEQIENTIRIESAAKWGPIFQEIGSMIPKQTRLTNVRCSESGILLDGQALTYEAIYHFVDSLNKCENIQSAIIVKTTNNRQTDKLINYFISCELTKVEK